MFTKHVFQGMQELLFLFLLFLPALILLSFSSHPPPLDLRLLTRHVHRAIHLYLQPVPSHLPAINDKLYPAVISRIVSHADAPTLLAFRATCRRLYGVANTHLAAHITVSDTPPFAVPAPQTPGLPFAPQYPGIIPGLVDNLECTRTLDVQYSDAWHALLREVVALLPRTPNLKLVRVLSSTPALEGHLARRERRRLHSHTHATVHFQDLGFEEASVARQAYGAGDVFINFRHSRLRPPAALSDGDNGSNGRVNGQPGQGGGGSGQGASPGHTVYLFLTVSDAPSSLAFLNRPGSPATEAWRRLLPVLAQQVVRAIVTGNSENRFIFVGDTESDLHQAGSETRRMGNGMKVEFGGTETEGVAGPKRRSVMFHHDCHTLIHLLDGQLDVALKDGIWPPQAARNRVQRQVGFATFVDLRKMVGDKMFRLIMAP